MKINVEFPHLHAVKKRLADGTRKTFYYHRLTRKRVEGEPGTAAFASAYEAACQRAAKQEAAFAGLSADFFDSREFEKLRERTRADYLKYRNIFDPVWGKTPIKTLEDKRIKGQFRAWRDMLAKDRGDKQADLIFATFRRVLSYANEGGALAINHAIGIPNLYKPDRADLIWTPADIDAFMQVAKPHMQIALIMALHLGRREADLVAITWGDFQGDAIAVTNEKKRKEGGRIVKKPVACTASLRRSLETYKRSLGRIPSHDETILTSVTGCRWVPSQFSSRFSSVKNEAGLKHLHFHDLRGTAFTVLAEEGLSPAQIASVTGHDPRTIHQMLGVYMSSTAKMNKTTIERYEQTWVAEVTLKSSLQ